VTDYEAVIGLEIHVQLATTTKMFCACELSFGDEPNVHTCPVCLGLPGSLPVLNARAVHFGTMIGLALGSEIARRSLFHRKNYFYPDLPKGYQISQYDVPLCLGGQLGEIRIHRVHLEEDAAKLEHVGESGRIHGADQTIVDFNRGGTPLVEIVTEPDFRSPEQAREWLTLLRATLKALGVSDVDMSQGSLRCDANVSIRPQGSTELGTKTELKNMNSFRFLEDGVRAEIERQTAMLDAGEPVVQETIHFDPRTGRLSALRSKEEAHDYRYFPEPDLVPLEITDGMLKAALSELPELPAARAERFEHEYALGPERSHLLAFRTELGDYYELALSEGDGVDPVELANWIPLLVERIGSDSDPSESNVSPASLAALAWMVGTKEVSRGNARDVLGTLVQDGGDPRDIVEDKGLGAIAGDDSGLGAAIDAAIAADPGAAEQVRGGNDKALGPLIAAVMRETKGRADGGEVRKLLLGRIGAS
jgi:aspartyl-tRNA(Asn)/glutamyl-tRNA(Gln) amidotransferase subunit B